YDLGHRKAPGDGRPWLEDAAGPGSEQENGEQGDVRSRVLRGGSWINSPVHCRSACRYDSRPANAYNYVGFRVCCLPRGRFSSAL
ncbi:MAG: SUMF1/EgtB/PvdO family nonheme iron enzyme, partial [Cyanobium sp.]